MKHILTITGRTELRRRWMAPLVGGALLWSSWPLLSEMAGRWVHDTRYSHGFLVPAFALFLLWRGRRSSEPWFADPSWWGLVPIVVGESLKLAGARYHVEWVAGLSLLPSLMGLALLVGGWPLFRRTGTAIAFLVFMIPLPHRLEVAIGHPLQRAGTLASLYALQTMGLNAVAEGNIIVLDHATIGVVEACNGLGMIFMFSAFTTGAALVLERPAIDKLLILLSTFPIALAANVLRISVTAVLHEMVGGRVAGAVYHDLAGWLMMPVALGALWLELFFLSRLLVERAPRQSAPLVVIPELGSGSGAGQTIPAP